MGFFARRLTTISIVYDFNNLGAALLARLDTFSVVNRATKSVFMGKRERERGGSPAWPQPVFFLPFAFFVRHPFPTIVVGAKGDHRLANRSKRRLGGADPLVPSDG